LQRVREEERKRISREIHDELGQMVTGLKMDVAWIDKRIAALPESESTAALSDKVHSMLGLLDEMVKSVRKIAAELRPGVLDDLGLVPAIEWQAREWEVRTGIECRLTSALRDVKVPPELGTALFRIFQETLTNVARHSQATRVDVRLESQGESLWMELDDNGRGILESETRQAHSFGLVGMKERAAMLGGEFQISGQPGHGTRVNVRLPLRPGGAAQQSGL
jgi:signal transduction histidine kinase